MISLKALLRSYEDFTVTYIVKNTSSKKKLQAYLKEHDLDPLHRIFVDSGITLKGEEIGFKLEAPIVIRKDCGKIIL